MEYKYTYVDSESVIRSLSSVSPFPSDILLGLYSSPFIATTFYYIPLLFLLLAFFAWEVLLFCFLRCCTSRVIHLLGTWCIAFVSTRVLKDRKEREEVLKEGNVSCVPTPPRQVGPDEEKKNELIRLHHSLTEEIQGYSLTPSNFVQTAKIQRQLVRIDKELKELGGGSSSSSSSSMTTGGVKDPPLTNNPPSSPVAVKRTVIPTNVVASITNFCYQLSVHLVTGKLRIVNVMLGCGLLRVATKIGLACVKFFFCLAAVHLVMHQGCLSQTSPNGTTTVRSSPSPAPWFCFDTSIILFRIPTALVWPLLTPFSPPGYYHYHHPSTKRVGGAIHQSSPRSANDDATATAEAIPDFVMNSPKKDEYIKVLSSTVKDTYKKMESELYVEVHFVVGYIILSAVWSYTKRQCGEFLTGGQLANLKKQYAAVGNKNN